MYDAWAAYDSTAVGYAYRAKHTAGDAAAARREAISYAAYRMLKERYALSVKATNTLPALDARMTALGYDIGNVSRDTSTPAGVGNSVYDAVHNRFINDGSLQSNGYKDPGYTSVNGFLNSRRPLHILQRLHRREGRGERHGGPRARRLRRCRRAGLGRLRRVASVSALEKCQIEL